MLLNGIQTAFTNLRMAVEASEIDGFITSVTGGLADFSVANLAKILVAGLGISVGLVLCWFGYRWVVRRVMDALKKGRA